MNEVKLLKINDSLVISSDQIIKAELSGSTVYLTIKGMSSCLEIYDVNNDLWARILGCAH